MRNMRTSVDAPMTDPIIDRSTKSLDKWRFMFHIFNMTTFTVAVISLGVSLTTYTAAPPAPSRLEAGSVYVINDSPNQSCGIPDILQLPNDEELLLTVNRSQVT